jgi:uncharacterized membrane protein (Fun14 family)
MENDDLKNIWSTFNKNINSAEKTNRQILKQMISRKSEIKLQIMKFQSILGILIIPFILLFVVVPMILNNERTIYLLIGSVLISVAFIYGFIQSINYYKLLNLVKPAFEPVKKTQERILTLRKFMVQLKKTRNIFFPILASAFVLISWDNINYKLPIKIALLLGTSIGIYFWVNFKYKLYFRDRIDLIDIEMNELNEYQ